MVTTSDGNRRRWAAAAGGALVALALLLMLFRAPEPVPSPSTAPPRPVVRLMRPDGTNAALDEETVMHDTTPLFLPTGRNATVKDLPRREPGKTFLDKETLKLGFAGTDLNLAKDLPPVVTLNGKPPGKAAPVDALTADAPGQMFLGFGRTDEPAVASEPRGGFVEIVATATGRRVLAEALPVTARPATDKPWQPMEFFAAIDAAGLVRPLVVTEGSRVEEVDVYFRNFLVRTFRVGERLPPGFYRIVVGP
ncbi:MAG: hypothetical protein HY736_05700 [Verrucomicrobia bacterium]|nr:hypothetical protein [Verrucomicrobiota bacterium]